MVRKVAPNGIITTVAGTGTLGYGNNGNGPATSIAMDSPEDIAVDGLGNLYVPEVLNMIVRKIDVFDAPSLSFASTYYDAASAAQDIAVLNLGNASLTFNSISTAPNFSLGGFDTSCGTSNPPLALAASCTLGIEFAPITVGSITGSVILTDNSLNASSAEQTIALGGTATPAPQTISFNQLPNVTYGVSPITLTATASSGLPVSYSVTGPASVNNSTGQLTITGAGSVTVTAAQSGSTDYTAATPVLVGFTVYQAPLTVTVSPSSYSRAVNTANPTFTGTVSGAVNNDLNTGSIAVTYSTTLAPAAQLGAIRSRPHRAAQRPLAMP